ncbi:MAG TPA: polysaccharide biosynthesis C-terminal domain-containing protein [Thermoleophilaceae bacterium]|nr:polysaccharide biosynthesis C-terminal domain-containing protein [Thermoleophilaceae bacterium]
MRNPLRVRFVRHVAMTGGTQVFQAAFAMLAGIVVARALGPSARGTLAVLTALGTITVLLASLGIHLSGVYFLGRFPDEADAIVSNNLLTGALGGIAAAVGLTCVTLAFQRELLHQVDLALFLTFVFCVPFLYFNQFGRTLLLGMGKVGQYNLPDIVGGSTLLAGTIAAIAVFGKHLEPLVALRIVVEVGIAAVILLMLRRSGSLHLSPSRPLLRRQLKYGIRNYTGSVFWLCLLQADIVLCSHFLGSGQTGIYAVAVSLGIPITILAAAIGTLTFQRVSSEEHRATRVAQTNRTARMLVVLLVPAVIGMAALAHVIVPLIYGERFSAGATALILLLPGFVAFSLEVVMMNFLAGEGTPPVVIWAPAVGLAVNIAANIFVIPRWGINGASVTSSVAYTVVLLLVLRYYTRSTRSKVADVFVTRRDDVRAFFGAAEGAAPAA